MCILDKSQLVEKYGAFHFLLNLTETYEYKMMTDAQT